MLDPNHLTGDLRDKIIHEGLTDPVTLFSALVVLQREYATLLSEVDTVRSHKKQWAIFYQLRELKDQMKIDLGKTQGLHVSKSTTAKQWVENNETQLPLS